MTDTRKLAAEALKLETTEEERGHWRKAAEEGYGATLFNVVPALCHDIDRLTAALAAAFLLSPAGEKGTPDARWRAEGKPDPHGTRYDCERRALAGGDMTDDEVANAVFLDPGIGNLTIAKDRIRWLSRKLAEASPAGEDETR